jgi:hypothetical protein
MIPHKVHMGDTAATKSFEHNLHKKGAITVSKPGAVTA